MPRACPRPRIVRRHGASTVELVLVLVVLILATFASLQFGMALIVKQAVAHATIVAAREAAKGADVDELQGVVEQVMQGHGIVLGEEASLIVENPLPQPPRGTLACQAPAAPPLDGDEVRVTLCVSLTAHPILNVLAAYGIDFTGHTFAISSVAKRE